VPLDLVFADAEKLRAVLAGEVVTVA